MNAPVDLEQFREAVDFYRGETKRMFPDDGDKCTAYADRLLSIIDNARVAHEISAPTGRPARAWTEQEKADCKAALRRIVEMEEADNAGKVASDPVVSASEVFRIAGGDTECEPNPTPERALEVLRDLRACYDEALCDKPAPVVEEKLADTQRAIIEAAERRGYERAKAEAVVVDGLHVVHELLTNIKRSCVRGRSVADPTKGNSSFIATCDHMENLADEAIAALTRAQRAQETPEDEGRRGGAMAPLRRREHPHLGRRT